MIQSRYLQIYTLHMQLFLPNIYLTSAFFTNQSEELIAKMNQELETGH